MFNWIKGDVIDLWQTNNKFFILINCQCIGYEIQILESIFIKFKTKQLSHKNIILWLKHIKKEDSDSLFGFISKDEKDFFVESLNVKGIGAQIGMALLNRFSINEITNAIREQDTTLISSVPGIGKKMTERLILELKNKLSRKSDIQEEKKNNNYLVENTEISSMIEDLEITLQSLNYPNKEVKSIIPILIKELKNSKNLTKEGNFISFEHLLKLSMNYLDKNNSKLV